MTKSPPKRAAGTRTPNRSQDSQQFKGVRKREWGRWVSEIRIPKSRERIWLGSYDSAQQAARAYDAAVYCLRGRKAKFNFPDSPPEIPWAWSMSREEVKAAATRFALEGADVVPSSSLSPCENSDFPATDIQPVSLEDEDFAFWESLLADFASVYCSNSNADIFPSPTPLASPAEVQWNFCGV